MRWTSSLPRWLAAVTAGLLSVSLVAALVTTNRPVDPPKPDAPLAKAREIAPLFAKTELAANPSALVVMPDETGVRGWVAGNKSYAGFKVAIKSGKEEFEATVGDDNTFTWAHTSAKPLPLTFKLGAADPLTARTTLPARQDKPKRTAFVVTDRSAYRPGHTLKFVAYVHDSADGIAFKPVADTEFTVDLVSEQRRTRATRLKLRSDAAGRVVGQYTFTDADELDHYALHLTERTDRPDDSGNSAAIPGGARVLLGEYRKTKVGVKLKGEIKDGKLVVTFEARDYLGREVKGTSATWSATVTKQADATKLTLDPTKFVADEGGPPSADEFDTLPDEERLLTLASGVSAMSFAGFGGRTVATREGKATFAAADAPKVTLDLWPEWLKGEHTVAVSGVFLDETGRENRASGTFSLTPVKEKNVLVGTAKELYATGETITANLTPIGLGEKDAAATTVVVVKLEASPSSPWVTPQIGDDGDGGVPDNTRIPPLGKPAAKPTDVWKAIPVFDPVKRKVLTVVPAVGGKATLDLKQAGAYKLLAITRLADGTTFQSETGVVVKAPAKLPGVALQLDARELPAGGRLSGAVHTRFAGAKLLLTLRDAGGVQIVKPLVAGANGVVRFDEALPANLRYGCAVCVQYPESAAVVHADQRDVFVTPTDRTLTVTATAPETVGPGAEVKLGLQVNREEEVDVIVSVFDESLLGVSGDLSKNIRDFYLADARGQGRAARDLTATRLGGVSVAELVAKAERMLKDKDAVLREAGLEQRLQVLVENWKIGKLNADNAVTLVRLAGFEVYLAHMIPGDPNTQWSVPKSARLADLLRRDGVSDFSRQYLSATVIDNVVLMGLADRNGFDPWMMHRGNTYTGYPCYGFGCNGMQFCGGFQCGGYQFNGFNGQFGISGWGFGGPPYGWGRGFGGGDFLGGQFGGIGGGFGGGGFGGVPGVAGFQGSHSYQSGNGLFSQPFVGGQMGFSAGFNRDFMPSAPGSIPTGGALPGLGVGQDVVRRDFADSAFWSTTIRTDKQGKATASFKVPDSLTNWRVQVTAISPKLHVGTANARFKTSRPVMIWPMLPRAFTEGDVVQVFGTVHNLSEKEQTIRVHLTAENGAVMSAAEQTVKVPANGSVPVYWTYRAGKAGMTDLLMSAKCDAGSDASLKKLPVTAAAVVERVTASGLVGGGNLKVTLPDGFDPKTAQVTVTVAPTLAADLADTLPYLVEYPYGCVEQTMSRFLPAIRVAAILKQAGISTNAKLEEKLPKVVEAGQKRLISLQQPDGGWGWNGDSQTHEMMTPYALFGLLAAEEAGYPCPNPDTIGRGLARLKQYLDNTGAQWDLAIKQGWNVAFTHNGRHATEINDALFCLWVAGMNADRAKAIGIDWNVWFGRIEKTAGRATMSDSGHAFALELAVRYKQPVLAEKLVAELHKRAQKGGDRVFWTKAGFSRWGDNTTEVTATVMKALVAHDPKDSLIPGVLAYFHSTKRGDRWDSTKDTAHVLYALCDYLVAVQAGPAAAGIVKVALNGANVGEVKLDSPASKSVKFAGKDLKLGDNTFAATGAEAAGGALVRVSVAFTRNDGKLTAARDHGVKVVRTVSVRDAGGKWSELKSGASVPTGSYVKVTVTATPATGDLRYFLIESPKPAGFETVPTTDTRFGALAGGHVLREDREAMTCFHYEQIGAATAEFVMMAEFEGEFTLAAARGELMYQPASGGHSDAFVLKVTAKK